MRTLLLSLLLGAPAAWACSILSQPVGAQPVTDAGIAPLPDAGVDLTAPGALVVEAVQLTLVESPCDGRGAACPQLDTVKVSFSATDDRTSADALRYVASFGGTEAEATAAAPSLLFEHDLQATDAVTAHLGVNRARSGEGFQRQQLCFTLAAVDAAGNVGPRSAARCVDTTSTEGATIFQGTPCSLGCSTAALSPLGLLALVLLRRRR